MFTEKYSAERIYPVHKIALRQMNMYNHLTAHKNYMYMSIALRLLFLSIVALTKSIFCNAIDLSIWWFVHGTTYSEKSACIFQENGFEGVRKGVTAK